jgi:hypothetical protein
LCKWLGFGLSVNRHPVPENDGESVEGSLSVSARQGPFLGNIIQGQVEQFEHGCVVGE